MSCSIYCIKIYRWYSWSMISQSVQIEITKIRLNITIGHSDLSSCSAAWFFIFAYVSLFTDTDSISRISAAEDTWEPCFQGTIRVPKFWRNGIIDKCVTELSPTKFWNVCSVLAVNEWYGLSKSEVLARVVYVVQLVTLVKFWMTQIWKDFWVL